MRILLIEDSSILVHPLVANLERWGYKVQLQRFEDVPIQMFFLGVREIQLAIINCAIFSPKHLEICRYIQMRKDARILVMSASVDTKAKVAALAVGVAEYISGSYSLDNLEVKIKTLAYKGARETIDTLKLGNLKLDSVNKKVSLGTRFIQMTQKEFDLLEYLMRHVGEIVSRKRILNNVWGKGYKTFSNTIDVHIKNLRRKLRFRNGPKIETCRASGYRITN